MRAGLCPAPFLCKRKKSRGDDMDKEEVKKKIYELVEKSVGKKKLKSSDIQKTISADLGITRDDVKAALKDLVDAGTLIYTYFGGSFVEIPPKE
jgi:hypothetical protein